ncbi:hypothetical protein [Roseicitreum antarcticum]|uniref:hypothetical protein n=1 Tax=Roseicitreum antarcticum TaxID=564137 RepID=UPI001160004B|nr:hypothetical protein [Roseicitreum antarcticum]
MNAIVTVSSIVARKTGQVAIKRAIISFWVGLARYFSKILRIMAEKGQFLREFCAMIHAAVT